MFSGSHFQTNFSSLTDCTFFCLYFVGSFIGGIIVDHLDCFVLWN